MDAIFIEAILRFQPTMSLGPRPPSQLAKISQHIEKMGLLIRTPEFSAALVNLLREFVQIDEVSIISYALEALPVIEYRENSHPTGHPNLDTFIQGAFVLDPYYVAATRQQKQGFFTLSELAPKGFRQSEYYRSYYRYLGLEDECGYILENSSGCLVNVSVARTRRGDNFTATEVSLLRDLTGSIRGVCELHQYGHEKTDKSGSRLEIDSAMAVFGADVLTKREREIISLILHGYAGKTIASLLGISIETVKLHRRNSYAKLEVKSQAELFFAFISNLARPSSPG